MAKKPNKIRLKYIATVEMGQSPPSSDYTNEADGIAFLQGTAEFGEKHPTAKIYSYTSNKISKVGDILFSVRAPVGDLNFSDKEYGIGRGLCAIRGNKLATNDFLWWALHSEKVQLKYVETGTTYSAVSTEDVGNLLISKFSLEEQNKISNFLNSEVGRIDKLIEEKANFIILLSEKRQALITQAVTKGTNPKVKLKDSGIDWLGEVPEHWELKKLKYLADKIGSGVTPKGGAAIYQKQGIPLLRSQNVHFSGLRLDDVAYISDEIHESMNNSKVEVGDVLLNITGASIGRCYFYEGQLGEANVNQHVCIVRPNKKVLTGYLNILFSSQIGQNQILLNQVGGGREGLTFDSLKSFVFPLPDAEEQAQILFEIDRINFQLSSIEKLSIDTIELLKERRQGLISAAVTGQLEIPS